MKWDRSVSHSKDTQPGGREKYWVREDGWMVSKSIDVAMWKKKYSFSLACLTWIPRKNNIDMFMSDSTISGNCFVPVDDFKEKLPKKKLGKNFDAQI